MKPLIIGSTDLQNLTEATKCLVKTCEDFNIGFQIDQISQDQFDQLDLESIDCIALPLSQVSFDRPKNVIIAGLSERKPLGLKILSRSSNRDITQILKLKLGTSIGVIHKDLSHQIVALNPSYQVHWFDTNEALTKALKDKKIHAIIDWDLVAIEGYEFFEIGPKEIIPPPGHGVFAFLSTQNNIRARKEIHQLHETEVAYCTNVERKILRQLRTKSYVAAHCTNDRMGNYHLNVFAQEKEGDFKKIKLSQSTFVKLAENACRKFNYEVSDI